MSIFQKKNKGSHYILNDKYVPTPLPTCGYGLENFVTSEYSANKPEFIEELYPNTESELDSVISSCDRHSTGTECDSYVDNKVNHINAVHEAEIAEHENQITRIRSAREMRMASLERAIAPLKKNVERLEDEIVPLEGLHAQFQLHIGRCTVSAGLLVTIISMIVDAAVNHSFIQSLTIGNDVLLWITVIGMSIMSDGATWALGTLLSHKEEKYTSQPLYYTVCAGLLAMFLLSVVGSVMIRWGSMNLTYGTIGANGEFIPKETFTLAEYGTTLLTSFITSATGVLSFGFSLDKNAFLVSLRERKKRELSQCMAELDPLLNELALLRKAPDPQERDSLRRAAAEHQIEAIHTGLKLHCRKLMTIRVNDPDFTEKMAASGEKLLADSSPAEASGQPNSTISLNKVC